jgi:translocation and assembly module TamA
LNRTAIIVKSLHNRISSLCNFRRALSLLASTSILFIGTLGSPLIEASALRAENKSVASPSPSPSSSQEQEQEQEPKSSKKTKPSKKLSSSSRLKKAAPKTKAPIADNKDLEMNLLPKIKFNGIEDELLDAVKQNLEIEDERLQPSIFGFAPSAELLVRKTKLALKVYGYYQPKVEINTESDLWEMTIQLGPVVTWNQVVVKINGDGGELVEFKNIVKSHLLKAGQAIRHHHYQQLKKSLEIQAAEFGFFQAFFVTQELRVNLENYQADVHLVFDTQQRYKIGDVSLNGSMLSDKFLASLINVKADSPYQQNQFSQTHQALLKSGFFENIALKQSINDQLHQVDVKIELQDIERYEFRSSIGYGSDTGPKINLRLSDRQFNPDGHRYHWQFDASKLAHSVGFQYYIPTFELDDYWINQISYKESDDGVLVSTSTELQSLYVDKINTHHLQDASIKIGFESLTVSDRPETFLEYAVLSWGYQYSSVESPLQVLNGWRYRADIRGSHKAISDPDLPFVQIEQDFKHINSLSENYRLISRLAAGITVMDLDIFEQSMPSQYRFFVGGDRSLRGYKYQHLAPLNQQNELSGGRHYMEASIELERKLNDQWAMAVFLDSGNAFNDWDQTNMESSLGFGLRWLTPIGAVKLDIAKPFDSDYSSRFHLTIAPDL